MLPNPLAASYLQRCVIAAASLKGCDAVDLGNLEVEVTELCRLWAGMGHVYQLTSLDGQHEAIVKHISMRPNRTKSFGDRRKAFSYQVEANFYEKLASDLIDDHSIKIPRPYFVERSSSQEIVIGMSLVTGESLDPSDEQSVRAVLAWLARFHASRWGHETVDRVVSEAGVQPTGSYWHLDTRPDEHESMNRNGWEGRLKRAARAIDSCLKRDPMQGLIHGDAKEANIMIMQDKMDDAMEAVMYDFQYCGKGTPTRDLSYFLCTSCYDDNESELIRYYYDRLMAEIPSGGYRPTFEHFECSLDLAYADLARFFCGWGFWGNDIRGRVQALLNRIDGGKLLASEEAYDEAIRKVYW